jgi:hypothetical protein
MRLVQLRPLLFLAGGVLAASLVAQQPALPTPEEFFRLAGAGLRGVEQERSDYWEPHVANSHRRILEAAAQCERHSKVLVLGAGNCTEIPLEELARGFDEVVLTDLDDTSMAAAVEDLPDDLIPKVHVQVEDVTAFAAPLMRRLWQAVETSETAEVAFVRIGATLSGLEADDAATKLPAADLVVSSLVLSELHRYPLNYAARLVRDKFGKRLTSWEGYERFRAQLQQVALHDHVRLLATVCRRGGAVYFADTVARGPLYEKLTPARRREALLAMLPDLARLGLFGELHGEKELRDTFAAAFEKLRPRWDGMEPPSREKTLAMIERLAADPASLPEPDRGAACETAVNLLCNERFDVAAETEAFERLLALYATAPDSFETLVPIERLEAEWGKRGLSARGAAESWWWLEYPCSVAYSPGAFQIRSWILKHAD